MRKKIVSINERRFLGAYNYARNNERIPEGVTFLAGVLLSMGLPETFYIALGGLIPLIAFAGSALAGSILGLVIYRRAPYRRVSFISTGTMPQAPPSENAKLKAAA